jgi:hypothetical protein
VEHGAKGPELKLKQSTRTPERLGQIQYVRRTEKETGKTETKREDEERGVYVVEGPLNIP